MNDSHGVKRVQRTRRRKFNVNGEDSSYKTKTVHVHDENERRQGAGDECHNMSKFTTTTKN